MAESDCIRLEDLSLRFGPVAGASSSLSANGSDLDARLAEQERQWILEALKEVHGVQVQAAKRLGVTERSLWYRVRKLGLDVEPTKARER
jgi:two-component system NtrC family response regulator